jgi:hypothetical protein
MGEAPRAAVRTFPAYTVFTRDMSVEPAEMTLFL